MSEQIDNKLAEAFGVKLRQLRQNRGWSQGQLGIKVGTDFQCVSKYERGISWPPMKILVNMAAVFEVSLDYLIRNEKDMASNKIQNQELLKRIDKIDELSDEDQRLLIGVIEAFIKKHRFEAVAQVQF